MYGERERDLFRGRDLDEPPYEAVLPRARKPGGARLDQYMSTSIYIYLYLSLFIYLSSYLSISINIYQSIYLPIILSIYLSIYLSTYI